MRTQWSKCYYNSHTSKEAFACAGRKCQPRTDGIWSQLTSSIIKMCCCPMPAEASFPSALQVPLSVHLLKDWRCGGRQGEQEQLSVILPSPGSVTFHFRARNKCLSLQCWRARRMIWIVCLDKDQKAGLAGLDHSREDRSNQSCALLACVLASSQGWLAHRACSNVSWHLSPVGQVVMIYVCQLDYKNQITRAPILSSWQSLVRYICINVAHFWFHDSFKLTNLWSTSKSFH